MLPVLPVPVPRRGERVLARDGLLTEAPVVFTSGAHLPLAGVLLVLPALEDTGLVGRSSRCMAGCATVSTGWSRCC